MYKQKKKINKKWAAFFLGLAYFIVVPLAIFISSEDRHNFTKYFAIIIPSVITYFILSGLLYALRHKFKRCIMQYDVVHRLKRLPDWLYRNRWPVGIGLWILLTILQIHGSAIGVYAKLLEDSSLDPAVIGFSRPDRFDEWLNMTSFTFSQYAPAIDGSTFNYLNSYLRAVPTDVFIVLGQPVRDVCMIFRPFQIGYLFLPPGNGLAFYWMGRLIILCLVSYEFGRIWLRDNHAWAWYYALMTVLSPAVQWWFGVNEFVEMLIAGQAAVIVVQKYLQSQKSWPRLAWGLLFSYLAVVYLYVMYPAWQIPFAYIFLIFTIWIIKNNIRGHRWGILDGLCAIVFIAMLVLPLWHTWHMSAEAIALIRSSVYPGARFITGGGLTWDWLFNSGLGLFTPFSGITEPQYAFNLCQFFDFAPLGILMAIYKMGTTRKPDFLLCGFLLLNAVFIAFCMLVWPRWLAAGTLLFQVPEGRLIIPISYINVVLLLRTIVVYPQQLSRWLTIILADGIALFSAWASFHYCANAYMPVNTVVLIAVTALGIACFCRYRSRLGPLLLGLFLCLGGMINPIAHGVASVYDSELAQEISQITKNDKGNWLVIGKDTTLNNYPPIFGAPTINSYNTYVAWENWNKLDLDDNARWVMNRCCHVRIAEITEEASTYKSEHGDLAELTMSCDDVKKLDVCYILSDSTDLQPLNTDSIQFKPIVWANGQIIYKVIYDKEFN